MLRDGRTLSLHDLRHATEAAVIAASGAAWRGDSQRTDLAARQGLETALSTWRADVRLLIGKGPRDAVDGLFHGQRFGAGMGDAAWDLAADPSEGCSILSKGATNAMACIAAAPAGTLFDPGPSFYMEKLVVPPAARNTMDPAQPVEARINALAEALEKPIPALVIYVQEKPRHRPLVERIERTGAKVALYPAGDIAAAVLACIPNSGIDALMGTGGCPEGVISAVAARALGGGFWGRIDPQLATERQTVKAAGLDTARWWRGSELVRSDDVMFCASGITSGLLLEGVTQDSSGLRVQSFQTGGEPWTRQVLTTWYPKGL